LKQYKYVIGLEYCGSTYSGWQRQKHSQSIQQVVEKSLSFVANEPISLICAGRTDAGVHATGQIAHFETSSIRTARGWLLGSNSRLPQNIRILWIKPIDENFHARFSAVSRLYRYIIFNSPVSSGLFSDKSSWYRQPLSHKKMKQAAQNLLGEQDFSAFRGAGCQSKSSFRNVQMIEVLRKKDLVFIDIRANAFLYHMVRNIVGSLLEVGAERQPVDWLKQLLLKKDRNLAGATAPACGLYFIHAQYPECYNLPEQLRLPELY